MKKVIFYLLMLFITGCQQEVFEHIEYDENGNSYIYGYESGFIDADETPHSYFRADNDTFSYNNIRNSILNNGEIPIKSAINIEGMVNYFDYEYIESEAEEKFGSKIEIGNTPWNKESKLMKITFNTKKMEIVDSIAMNTVFVIDTSASMNDEGKIEYVKKSIKYLTEIMRAKDKISIVAFADKGKVITIGVKGNEKERIDSYINNLVIDGNSNGYDGIRIGYNVAKSCFIKGGNNRVILFTDGDFNEGKSETEEIKELVVQRRKSGIYFSAVACGNNSVRYNKLETMSKNGNGNMYYIDSLNEAKKLFNENPSKVIFTEAKDVRADVRFNPEIVKSYRLIGYEKSIINDEVFYESSSDGAEIGAGSSFTAFYEIYLKSKINYQNKNICSISLKYKNPNDFSNETKPNTIDREVNYLNCFKEENEISDDFKFASAVAEFGLILRNSDYKGSATYESILSRAKSTIGEKENNSKSEFVKIVEKARDIKSE